jgi:hypothetical protein
MAQGQDYEALQLGIFSPKAIEVDELGVGEVGFLVANIKNVGDAKIGDTITESARPTVEPFPGFKELKPMVFAGLYPVEGHEYPELRDALEKLRLNDASFFYEPETSAALGFGFRCGFLGLRTRGRGSSSARVRHGPVGGAACCAGDTTDGKCRRSTALRSCRMQAASMDRRAGDPAMIRRRRVRRRHSPVMPGQARRQKTLEYLASDHVLVIRSSIQRSRPRFLRQAEDHLARLCVARLAWQRRLA